VSNIPLVKKFCWAQSKTRPSVFNKSEVQIVITVKIQCGCGQKYAFDVEPVNGRMSSSVACPVCGADGTDAANEIIAKSLAAQTEAAPNFGAKLRTATPTARAVPPVSPAIPRTPIHQVAEQKPKLAWYEHIWIALPIALVGFGGAIGGACGGTAWAANKMVFKKTANPILRYVWTGLISASAVIVYLVIAMFFLSLFKKHSETPSSETYNWSTFASQDGNFSALFPGTPKEESQNEIFLTLHSFTFEVKNGAYIVSYGDFPEKLHVSPTDKFFDGSRNGALGKDGKLLQEKSMTIEGFPGREIQFEKKGGEAFVVDRYFLAANRMYQVMVVVPKQDQSSTNISYFLDSFSLLKTNAQ
jgi:hypothetical protein